MSARDAESGSSTYKGGSRSAGGLGNGGIGGGMGGGGNYGGGMGGGAGRNGGIGNRTGLTTGNTMYGVAGRNGVTFSGRPGGFAQQPGAFGIRPQPAIGTGPLSGVRRPGVGAVPAAVPGVNPVPQYPAYNAEMALPEYPPVQEINIPFPDFTPPAPVPQPPSLPPYAGPGTDPRIISVPSPYGNTVYGTFNGNHMSVYGNPQLGTPTYGSLSNLKDHTGANYGGSR